MVQFFYYSFLCCRTDSVAILLVKVKALHLYSATSGNCSYSSAVRHRL